MLIHSKAKTADEIAEVAMQWDRPTPLVAVPTTYCNTPLDDLAALGIKVVIYANHGLRGALKASPRAVDRKTRSRTARSLRPGERRTRGC